MSRKSLGAMTIFANKAKTNIFLTLLTLAAASSAPAAFAGAWKCKAANGTVVISSTPCEDSEKTVSVHHRENIPENQRRAAIANVQKQKAFVAKAENERRTNPSYATQGHSNDKRKSIAQIDKCLMSVGATTGLTPNTEAHRKVRCFEGSRELTEKCEYSVASTTRLSKSDEAHYRQECRRVTPD